MVSDVNERRPLSCQLLHIIIIIILLNLFIITGSLGHNDVEIATNAIKANWWREFIYYIYALVSNKH